MRKAITKGELLAQGMTHGAIRWKVTSGRWQRLADGLYIDGGDPPTPMERSLAVVTGTGGVASGTLAGILHGLDAVQLRGATVTIPRSQRSRLPGVRRFDLDPEHIGKIDDYRCTDGLQTMLDLAATLDDLQWEQALESALRQRLTTVIAIEEALAQRRVGNARIRRVLALRPPGAPPTGSLLETLMVQLIRTDPTLPNPQRQTEVRSTHGTFIAFVDLAWPNHGVFLELDGQQHLDQPVYDSRRETSIVATTGWLPGRFTWYEVTRIPKPTLRRVGELLTQASRPSRYANVS